MKNTKVLIGQLFLLSTLLVMIAIYAWGIATHFDRPLWADEVHTLRFSSGTVGDVLDTASSDVHPPLYYLFANSLQSLFPALEPILATRLGNAAGVAMILGGLAYLHRALGTGAATLAALSLLSYGTLAYYTVEARSYFLILALSWLMTAASTFGRGRSAEAIVYTTALIIAMTHYFGTAVAIACLAYRATVALRRGDFGAVRRATAVAFVIVALFTVWLFQGIESYARITLFGFWIDTSTDTYTAFVRAAVLPLVCIAAALAVGGGRVLQGRGALGHCIFPLLIVLTGTAILSLIQPIVTTRNLIVLVPHVCFAAAVLANPYLTRPIVSAAVAVGALATVPDPGDNFQAYGDMEWVARQAFTEDCSATPLAAPDSAIYALRAAATIFEVPPRPVVSFDPEAMNDFGRDTDSRCNVLAASLFTPQWTVTVSQTLRAQGIAAEVRARSEKPDVTVAPQVIHVPDRPRRTSQSGAFNPDRG